MPGYLDYLLWRLSDMASGKMMRYEDIKSPCDIGSLVAEGMMVTVPSECGCNYEVKGYRALTSAGSHPAAHGAGLAKPPDGARHGGTGFAGRYRRRLADLSPRPAAQSPPAPPPWAEQPKFSGSGRPRATPYSGARSAAGPRLAADFLATAARGGGGHALVRLARRDRPLREGGRRQGSLELPHRRHALSPRRQSTLAACWWAAATAAFTASMRRPAAASGNFWPRSLIAACSGSAICINTWPVEPGVVVHDGVAYAVAGSQKENGIHAYAFDPESGNVLWEKDDAGTRHRAVRVSAYHRITETRLRRRQLLGSAAPKRPGYF